MGIVTTIGQETIRRMDSFGDFCRFSGQAFMWLFASRWKNLRLIGPRLYEVGASSVPVIVVMGIFVGSVLAVQTVVQFKGMGFIDMIGTVVPMSVLRELGPILAAVLLAGRVGGGLTAELGTMRVTEQIDALRVMGADPIRVLVVPRLIACTILIPILVVYGSFTGILGGYYLSVYVYNANPHEFWRKAAETVNYFDIFYGPIKSVFFGMTIGLICCFKGFRCAPGAAGVGRACTQSFVACALAILLIDLFMGMLMNTIHELLFGLKATLF